MKNILGILLCFTFLYGCKGDTSKATSKSSTSKSEKKKTAATIQDFECATFFKKGDYSALCFNDAKFPETITMGCIFDFVTNGDKQEQSIKVMFTDKSSAMLAEVSFNLIKNNYKKGKFSAVSTIGDDAFFDVHGTDLKSLSRSNKDLHVRHNNMVFVIMAEYLSSKGEPCFYSDKNLIAFADLIIQNLDKI